MKILIAEDDFLGRRLMQLYLSEYGTCDVAVTGVEAVELFKQGVEEGRPYDLVCLDIMMPQMDGHAVLKTIRDYERLAGIRDHGGVKIIMTTALDDFENIKNAFTQQCEAYLVKPIEKEKIRETLKELHLIG
ncbi:MAG: response regulator [Desulfitobacteriia bacterium]|jgi:two-component system chemotaxis response regulator CheY